MSLLGIRSVSSGYGRLIVTHDIDMHVDRGEIVLIVGPNGAGKTTLLKTIAGHLPVRNGRIDLDGEDVTSLSAYERALKGVGYVPQERKVFGSLTVAENLESPTLFRPELREMVPPIFERFPRLDERRSQRASTLSGGERQMLAVGAAMVGNPDLVLLDEPTAGLAPRFVDEIVTWMSEVASSGRAVVWVVEQDPGKVAEAANRVYFMAGGEVRDERPASDLTDSELLRQLLFEG